MKKIIIVCLLSVFFFFPFSVKADAITDLMTQYQNVLIQLIEALKAQIALLQVQIADILAAQQAQTQTLQNQSATLGQIKQNTAPAPVPTPAPLPEVKKDITFRNNCSKNPISKITYCDIKVYYWENNKIVDNSAITISTDNGYFITTGSTGYECTGGEPANWDGSQRKGNIVICPTGRINDYYGKTGVILTFYPSIKGIIFITATSTGVIGTTSINNF